MKIRLTLYLSVILLNGHNAAYKKTANREQDFSPQPPTPYLSPEESMKQFELPEGYSLELVLSDPEIEEPVICVFDGNGRMFVAEMRTYMQDIDGSTKFEKISRVSMHEDTNGDGKMDKHSVFIDNLLLPRILLPLDDRLIVGETYTLDLYSYRDINGDGVADEKKKIYEGGERGGNRFRFVQLPFAGRIDHVGGEQIESRIKSDQRGGLFRNDGLMQAVGVVWGGSHNLLYGPSLCVCLIRLDARRRF